MVCSRLNQGQGLDLTQEPLGIAKACLLAVSLWGSTVDRVDCSLPVALLRYWRGFSRGLKETKNTVHSDGDEVLPSVPLCGN